MLQFCFLLSVLFALGKADPLPAQPVLNGVTISNNPFIIHHSANGTYSGFAVDLITAIANKAGFTYTLYSSPDGRYGMIANGTINGMLGEVKDKKADFAIADITVTDPRKEYVDFTEPFFNIQLSAIARKEDVPNLTSLEGLVARNQEIARSATPTTTGQIGYAILKHGSTYHRLLNTKDSVGQAIFTAANAKPEKYLVPTLMQGIDQVNAGGTVLIAESSFADFITGNNCALVVLPDTRELHPQEYAIALPKGSKHLDAFNKAIRELKADGTIEGLRAKHWSKKCA